VGELAAEQGNKRNVVVLRLYLAAGQTLTTLPLIECANVDPARPAGRGSLVCGGHAPGCLRLPCRGRGQPVMIGQSGWTWLESLV
jgi:hypothetical protein